MRKKALNGGNMALYYMNALDIIYAGSSILMVVNNKLQIQIA
jgi:hypothetical protein